MTRNPQSIFRSTLAALILTSGVALAQDQPPTPPQAPPPANGGWRRVGDVPQADPQARPTQVDPTQPVDRSDAYGQSAEPMPPQSAPPQGMPQASNRQPYGTPTELTLK